MKRLFLSISERDLSKLDSDRKILKMNRSQYIRYLLSNYSIPDVVTKADEIEKISEIDLSLRVLALKEDLNEHDRLKLFSEIKDLKELLQK